MRRQRGNTTEFHLYKFAERTKFIVIAIRSVVGWVDNGRIDCESYGKLLNDENVLYLD